MSDTTVETSRNPIALVARVLELYRDGGVTRVTNGVEEYLRTNTPFLQKPLYQQRRIDNERRWEIIETHLEDGHSSLLDVGCSQGYFTGKAAEYGLESVGVDLYEDEIAIARRRHEGRNVTFEATEITPQNVGDLPQSDVVLFLTVHHHWVDQYGFDAAAEMIRTVCRGSELLVYEPPGDRYLGSDTNDIDRSVNEYYRDLIRALLNDDVRIAGDYTVPYTGGGRKDPLLVVDTSEYGD